ncbi:uncharacterized protein M421DRAFT_406880 [Didymella exigua CBS 183.55]|uniref:Uncharacterized protein n=1 Tax=Didymella exigua CBS 183.55 TaxID=1150837 RepID=A0A6A5R881_9PLEO|nr:uncharacterized protein M421DRAFT_406880 [Didymella exigua CBS 183.55]KAF1923388.1 hypothetical protein M421DRAFT_406880 [Didymella exigua CBS 183.55]
MPVCIPHNDSANNRPLGSTTTVNPTELYVQPGTTSSVSSASMHPANCLADHRIGLKFTSSSMVSAPFVLAPIHNVSRVVAEETTRLSSFGVPVVSLGSWRSKSYEFPLATKRLGSQLQPWSTIQLKPSIKYKPLANGRQRPKLE